MRYLNYRSLAVAALPDVHLRGFPLNQVDAIRGSLPDSKLRRVILVVEASLAIPP